MNCFCSDRGAAFIAPILAMGVVSIIGSVALKTNTLSTFSRLDATASQKAVYMAESGFRYASTAYSTAQDKKEKLKELHGQSFTLNGRERFDLTLYSYYLTVAADPAGTTTLLSEVSSAVPHDQILTSGKLKIGANFYSYSSAAYDGNAVTFTMEQPLPSILVHTPVFPVAMSEPATDQVIGNGMDITLAGDTPAPFPLTGGTIAVTVRDTGGVYHVRYYTYKTFDPDGNRLIDIGDPYNETMTLDGDSEITLQRYEKVRSTGVYAEIDRRTISKGEIATYSIDATSALQDSFVEVTENFDDIVSMYVPVGVGRGTYEHVTTDGDDALRVIDVQGAPGSLTQEGIIGVNSGNFRTAWQENSNYLTYGAQVKIRVSSADYYADGISFRIDNFGGGNMTFLGLSLIRSQQGKGKTNDGIPDELAQATDTPMVVLWKLSRRVTDNGKISDTRSVLASMEIDESLGIVDEMGHLVDWSTIRLHVEEKTAGEGTFAGQRVNDIEVYVAAPESYPRGNLMWEGDYFKLVTWNTTGDETTELVDDTTIRISDGQYTTDWVTWPSKRYEVGLHAYGISANSGNVYFDDLSIRFPENTVKQLDDVRLQRIYS